MTLECAYNKSPVWCNTVTRKWRAPFLIVVCWVDVTGGARAIIKWCKDLEVLDKNSWADTTPLYNPRKITLKQHSITKRFTEDLLKSLWPTYVEFLFDVPVSLEEELYLKEICAVEMFGYFAFCLLTGGKLFWPIIKLNVYVSRFRQQNYFSKFCDYYLGLQ